MGSTRFPLKEPRRGWSISQSARSANSNSGTGRRIPSSSNRIRRMRSAAALLLLLLAASALPAQDRSLHLAIGDPARKNREAKVVLDGVTDTRTGEVLTPEWMARRLGDVR